MDTLLELLNHIRYKIDLGDYCSNTVEPVKDLIMSLLKEKILEENGLYD